jgi:hypothetical protein
MGQHDCNVRLNKCFIIYLRSLLQMLLGRSDRGGQGGRGIHENKDVGWMASTGIIVNTIVSFGFHKMRGIS